MSIAIRAQVRTASADARPGVVPGPFSSCGARHRRSHRGAAPAFSGGVIATSSELSSRGLRRRPPAMRHLHRVRPHAMTPTGSRGPFCLSYDAPR